MRDPATIMDRATALRDAHAAANTSRQRVRAIMNGGVAAVQALLGPKVKDQDLPWPNLMLSGLTRLAQKLSHVPDVKIDTPPNRDSERAARAAEKRERIVAGYDSEDRMELHLPQVGRWLPGYGFAPWTIQARLSPSKDPYPHAEMRDPFDCYPSAWGVDQQPAEMAVWRRISVNEAKRLFPEYEGRISRWEMGYRQRGPGGGVFLGSTGDAAGRWASPSGQGMALVEFWDGDGTHYLLPDIEERVDFVPNPLETGPAFVVIKRFSFDQLTGQYDHIIGLMAAMAKINAMAIVAMTDAVFAPTNIYGDGPIGKPYEMGRNKTNRFPPGTKVDVPQRNLPYQLFETINRLERELRLVAGYPVTDDAQSPNSWVTGAGLDELKSSPAAEVAEYQKVLQYGLMDLDAKRLEWDYNVSRMRAKPIGGMSGIGYAETYQPNRHIRGLYRTKRRYGMMSGWDDSAVIIGGLQLLSAGVIDRRTFQENIRGLDELSEINERIYEDKALDSLLQGLVAAAQQGDQRALGVQIKMLPESKLKATLEAFYMPEQQTPDQMQQVTQGMAQGMASNPDVQTILSRLPLNGSPQAGAQTVARV